MRESVRPFAILVLTSLVAGVSFGCGASDGPTGALESSGSDDGEVSTTAADTSAAVADSSTGDASTTDGPAPPSTVLFVNFDGATLVGGADDSRTNSTSLEVLVGAFAPYGGSDRSEIIARVASHWDPFAVQVTDVRPAAGDYTMVMVGPTNPLQPAIAINVANCGNSNPNSVAFAFIAGNEGWDSDYHAVVISRVAAKSLGLNGVTSMGDLLDVYAPGMTFLDACSGQIDTVCVPATDACPPGEQNSYRELEALLGTD